MVWIRPFTQPEEERMGLFSSASLSPQPPDFGFLKVLPKLFFVLAAVRWRGASDYNRPRAQWGQTPPQLASGWKRSL